MENRVSGRAVLLVGTARSGTTWTARTLARAAGTVLINEPDNVDANPASKQSATQRGFGPYRVLEPGADEGPYETLWRLALAGRLPRRTGARLGAARMVLRLPQAVRRPVMAAAARGIESTTPPRLAIVKSVLCHFSLEWIAQRFEPRVVVMQRNPLNVVSSWHELDVHAYDLHLRADIRERFAEPMGVPPPPAADGSRLATIAWWVGFLNAVLASSLERHPEWMLLTHERLIQDSVAEFHALYRDLGLAWTSETQSFLTESGYNRPTFRRSDWVDDGRAGREVSQAQGGRWRDRLSAEQVDEVRAVLEAFPNGGWISPPGSSSADGDSAGLASGL
jgi:hypothetical protein